MPAVSERKPSVSASLSASFLASLLASLLAAAAGATLFAFSGCAGIKSAPLTNGAGGGGGGSGTAGHPAGVDGGETNRPDGPAALPDAGSCVKVSCTPPNGQYCGKIGDGCSGVLDCGDCPGTQICEKGLCVQGASCVPATCPTTGTLFCGKIGDGCGRAVDCGMCAGNLTCNSNGVCVDPGCVPKTCNGPNGVQYCGMIGDSCGGTLNCTCTIGTCGGGGIPGVCGATTCPPPLQTIQCNPTGGGQYCGTIGNGCGGIVNCPTTCPMGAACPANGVCPGSTSTGCQNLQCQIQTCTPATKTSISGTVYDPAGKNPLYNAQVYIPNTINGVLDPVPEGVSCDMCNVTLSGFPIASALSDTAGHFTITNAPSGTNIPLVIQVGKWRREVFIPLVNPCVDNPVPADLTHLPQNQTQGHMPKIAITTGKSDAVECFVRKTGIADSEFTNPTGTGRVNLYTGGEPVAGGGGQGAAAYAAGFAGGTGAFPFAGTALWNDPNKLLTYDILLMSCEGGQFPDVKKPLIPNIKRYADAGGRLFNGHLHYYWLRNGPIPWPTTATYLDPQSDLTDPTQSTINTTFPKGAALADWLVTVGASTTRGALTLYGAQSTVPAVTPPTQGWINLLPPAPTAVEYLTFNTPVEAPVANQCGRVVETDIHVKNVISSQNGKDTSANTVGFPGGCKSTIMSPQEKALEFLFFDLAACVQPDTQQPQPPLVPPPGVPTSPPPSAPPPPRVPPPPPPPPPDVIP